MLNPSGCFGGTSHSAGHSTPSIPRWGRGLAFALWVLTPSPGRGATSGPSPQVPRRGRGDPTASLHGISDLAPRASGVGIGGGESEGAQGTTPAPTRFSPMGCKAHGATSIPGGTYTPSSGSALPAPYPKSPRAPCSLCFPNAPNPARGSWQTGHREVSPLPGICGRATRLILSFPTGTRGRAIRKPDCLGAIKPGESGGRLAPTRTVPLHRIDMQRPICCPWGAPGARLGFPLLILEPSPPNLVGFFWDLAPTKAASPCCCRRKRDLVLPCSSACLGTAGSPLETPNPRTSLARMRHSPGAQPHTWAAQQPAGWTPLLWDLCPLSAPGTGAGSSRGSLEPAFKAPPRCLHPCPAPSWAHKNTRVHSQNTAFPTLPLLPSPTGCCFPHQSGDPVQGQRGTLSTQPRFQARRR